MANSVIPEGFGGSTHLNSYIRTYDDLADRIKIQLGAPRVNIDACDGQIYDCISNAIEYFTKFAGYTEEYLVFNSKIYQQGKGIKMDDLINNTPETNSSMISGLSAGYDYDMADYRKVVDVFSFDPGQSTGVNTLFTLETAMAQQIYASTMVGGEASGFDLVTWDILKGYIETRNRVLALTPYFRFDERSQILRIIPEPHPINSYTGVVGCYLERPIKDLIKERWVHRYAYALSCVVIGNMRGKIAGLTMFGGGTINFNDLLSRGLLEKDALEVELTQVHIDSCPPNFYLG